MKMRFLASFGLILLLLAHAPSAQAIDRDKSLYQDSIHVTKESIANDTLELFYHDALDYYHDDRYDEALQLLDKICSINPHYRDAASLRDSIRKKQQNTQMAQNLDTVRDWMRKGDQALHEGQNVLAISYWKQALAINPDYAPAKKKIDGVNQALARREFESGYIHYHHGEFEDALDSWSNAIAIDPTYKQRGLLLLMSKVQLQVERDQTTRLASQGYEQYQQGKLEAALQSYEELFKLQPRNEEARRMTGKIKIQLGQVAFKSAQNALAGGNFSEAVAQADKSIQYNYETIRSEKIKAQAKQGIEVANRPKPPKKPEPKKPATPATPAAEPASPPPPTQLANPEEAMQHYRQGMAAIRKKDFHLALDELEMANQLDPSNERIYMARERARQEWMAASGNRSNP